MRSPAPPKSAPGATFFSSIAARGGICCHQPRRNRVRRPTLLQVSLPGVDLIGTSPADPAATNYFRASAVAEGEFFSHRRSRAAAATVPARRSAPRSFAPLIFFVWFHSLPQPPPLNKWRGWFRAERGGGAGGGARCEAVQGGSFADGRPFPAVERPEAPRNDRGTTVNATETGRRGLGTGEATAGPCLARAWEINTGGSGLATPGPSRGDPPCGRVGSVVLP